MILNTNSVDTSKYVFVLVHADIWGAYNANRLVKAVAQHGAKPILIVSRSTKGKDGKPATKIEDLKLTRIIKEEEMLRFFNVIERLEHTQEPSLLTFNLLAKRYCADGEAHFATTGGPKGGREVLDIFNVLAAKDIRPEVVLSGDTLAILPAEITDTYDCFGTHPGPLPEIRGMQGTARSLIHSVLYDWNGNRLENPTPQLGNARVKGSFFNLMTNLDEGPVIGTGFSLWCPGMCLTQLRMELYHALTDLMISHLGALLDQDSRRELLADAKEKKAAGRGEKHDEIPEMDQTTLQRWAGDGVAYVRQGHKESEFIDTPTDTPDYLEVFQNMIMDPVYLNHRMRDFYPGVQEEFEAVFNTIFGTSLEALDVRQAELLNPHMRAARTMESQGRVIRDFKL